MRAGTSGKTPSAPQAQGRAVLPHLTPDPTRVTSAARAAARISQCAGGAQGKTGQSL